MLLEKNDKVLGEFLEHPHAKFQLRELSRITKLSTTAVKSRIIYLLKENLIARIQEKNYIFYMSNFDSSNFKLLKKFYNIKTITDSGLFDFLEEEMYPECIMLFGSVSKGEDTEKSDIDIFLLASKRKDIDINKYEVILKRSVNLLIMNRDEFDKAKKKNPDLINNIINGTVIYGSNEVV